MRKICIEHNNQIYFAEAETIKGVLWIHFQGKTWNVVEEKKIFGKGTANKHATGEIVSPMPGKVTKIFCKVGDQVTAEKPLLVMEAMKMEYTLKADLDGIVESLVCQTGDQVVLGKLLIKISPRS